MLVYAKDGKVINIEGDPDNPNNEGSLCSKGAAAYELYASPKRLTKVMYRAPGSEKTRDASFKAKDGEVTVNRAEGLAQLGGAAHDTDECYMLSKMARGLGIVNLEHQARI